MSESDSETWSTVQRPSKPTRGTHGSGNSSLSSKITSYAPRPSPASCHGAVGVMMDPPGGGPDFQIDVPWGSDATVGGPLREPLTQLRDSMGSRAPACCKVNVYWMVVYHDFDATVTDSVVVLLPLASEMEISHIYSIILPQAAYCYRSPHASRALQLLLERGNNQQKWALVEACKGRIFRLSRSQIAMYSLSKAIMSASEDQKEWISEELSSKAAKIASGSTYTFLFPYAMIHLPRKPMKPLVRIVLDTFEPSYALNPRYTRLMGAVLETGEPQDVVEACLHLIPLFFNMLSETKNSAALLHQAMDSLASLPVCKERCDAAQAALDLIMRSPGELEAAALTEAGAIALGGLLEACVDKQGARLLRTLRNLVDETRQSRPKLRTLAILEEVVQVCEQMLQTGAVRTSRPSQLKATVSSEPRRVPETKLQLQGTAVSETKGWQHQQVPEDASHQSRHKEEGVEEREEREEKEQRRRLWEKEQIQRMLKEREELLQQQQPREGDDGHTQDSLQEDIPPPDEAVLPENVEQVGSVVHTWMATQRPPEAQDPSPQAMIHSHSAEVASQRIEEPSRGGPPGFVQEPKPEPQLGSAKGDASSTFASALSDTVDTNLVEEKSVNSHLVISGAAVQDSSAFPAQLPILALPVLDTSTSQEQLQRLLLQQQMQQQQQQLQAQIQHLQQQHAQVQQLQQLQQLSTQMMGLSTVPADASASSGSTGGGGGGLFAPIQQPPGPAMQMMLTAAMSQQQPTLMQQVQAQQQQAMQQQQQHSILQQQQPGLPSLVMVPYPVPVPVILQQQQQQQQHMIGLMDPLALSTGGSVSQGTTRPPIGLMQPPMLNLMQNLQQQQQQPFLVTSQHYQPQPQGLGLTGWSSSSLTGGLMMPHGAPTLIRPLVMPQQPAAAAPLATAAGPGAAAPPLLSSAAPLTRFLTPLEMMRAAATQQTSPGG